jgi:hypothetical protein
MTPWSSTCPATGSSRTALAATTVNSSISAWFGMPALSLKLPATNVIVCLPVPSGADSV